MPRRRRRRANVPARLLLGSLAVAAVGYLLIPPVLEFRRWEELRSPVSYAMLVEQQLARLLGTAWFFMLGACVGSFLNVVVWRVPRGRSLMGRSHCPWCAVQIKSRDNFPVFGWVLLRGRCRTCRLPIAPRYPLVELTTGLLFVLLLAVELLTGGANLPVRPISERRGFLEAVFTPEPELLGLYFFHCWMIFNLLGWTLIRWDGCRIPLRYIAFTLLVTLACGVAFPFLHPVQALMGPLSGVAQWSPWLNRAGSGALGLAAGVLLGNELDMAWARRRPQATAFLGLVGAQLGWQAAFAVAVMASLLLLPLTGLVRRRPSWRRAPLGGLVAIAALVQLLLWRQTAAYPRWWPGPNSPLQTIALAGLAVVGLQYVIRVAAGRDAAAEAE